MCGIFFMTQKAEKYNRKTMDVIKTTFRSGEGRGPDNSVFTENFYASSKWQHPVDSSWNFQHYFHLGFHRLSINGLDDGSNQPIIINDVALICNGEIYNYKELYEEHNITPQTHSDCEVILHLYLKYGTEKMLSLLHGVYAFVIIDDRNMIPTDVYVEEEMKNQSKGLDVAKEYYDADIAFYYDRKVVVARDAYGIRPMFIMNNDDGSFGVSSLLKQLNPILNSDSASASASGSCSTSGSVSQFEPGTYSNYFFMNGLKVREMCNRNFKTMLLYKRGLFSALNNDDMLAVCYNVNKYLNEAVKMRVENTDRPVACLLSGGLDSSLITALAAKYVKDPKHLNTFSIGMAGGSDLEYARKVAQHLGTNHHEVIVSEDDFFAAIPTVIQAIESYDTTTVRASVGNYLIGKYISEHCDAKVIFNGDGSDELFGGYLYMHCAPNSEEFDKETKRLLDNIHYFDVLRSDRCISCHGLEPRTPFMDVNLIAYYLSVNADLRNHRNDKLPEKYILRKAFSQDGLLPNEVLWRTKEAFSDGVSNEGNSWHTIIKRRLEKDETCIMDAPNYNPELTLEQNYYRQVFDEYYPKSKHIIPYYWMPNFIKANDCSARSLEIYKELQE